MALFDLDAGATEGEVDLDCPQTMRNVITLTRPCALH